jgi:hypothetical protein
VLLFPGVKWFFIKHTPGLLGVFQVQNGAGVAVSALP